MGGPSERALSAKGERPQPQSQKDLELNGRMMKDYGEFDKVCLNKGISSDLVGKEKLNARRLQVNNSDDELDESDNSEDEQRQQNFNSFNSVTVDETCLSELRTSG